jgi:hypothetical protein
MTESQSRSLILLPASALKQTTNGPTRVLSRMTSGALQAARAHSVTVDAVRYRVGAYRLREPDYNQVLLWSKTLEMEPEALLAELEQTRSNDEHCAPFVSLEVDASGLVDDLHEVRSFSFRVVDGHIDGLVWDLEKMPIRQFCWLPGLAIRELVFRAPAWHSWEPPMQFVPPVLSDLPPSLELLSCHGLGLERLSLAGLTRLRYLDCSTNRLDSLELGLAPNLVETWCSWNKIQHLDLSNAASLLTLDCSCNPLATLDLSRIPELKRLDCSDCGLSEMDLSLVGKLTYLSCGANKLSAIDLRQLLDLTGFVCFESEISQFDFSMNTGLRFVNLSLSHLPRLDVSNLMELQALDCGYCGLCELSLPNHGNLRWLYCCGNSLRNLDMSLAPQLEWLNCEANSSDLFNEIDIRGTKITSRLWVDPGVRVLR